VPCTYAVKLGALFRTVQFRHPLQEVRMQRAHLNDSPHPVTESISLASRSLLIAFCLAAGLSYRILVGILPASAPQAGALVGLAAFFLLLAIFAKKTTHLIKYWEIPFAFFVFTTAGIIGDQGGFIQHTLVRNILHDTPTANNPLASTVMGSVLAQVVSTASLIIPILLLTKASGNNLKSIFVNKTRTLWPLIVGVVGFVLFYLISSSERAQRFFPNHGVTRAQLLALTPALVVLVLCNGLREELWFRGLFLKKYGVFLSPFSSNMLSAIIFTSFHAQVQYTSALLPFLVITLILGLLFGYLMQKSGSILASTILHAGSDIPIFLGYLSYVL